MRVTLKSISLLYGNVFKANRNLRNCVRPLTHQQVTIPNQETLTGRLFLYLNLDKDKQSLPKCTSEILREVRQNPNQLYKLSTNELVTVSGSLKEHLTKSEIMPILKELDIAYCFRLSELTTTDILRLLNVYMTLIPNHITQFKFYNSAVKVLYNSLSSLSSNDLLQLIFYIGLRKKSVESQTMLRQCLKSIDKNFILNLTSEELCIICNATFKTSTKINNKALLEKVRSYINNNLSVLNDTALFVTLIKTLRHNRYQNDDLLNTISCTVFFNKTFASYSFPINCHIMALFADFFFYDETFFKMLTKKCLEQLTQSRFASKEVHPMEQLRGKDIKRFLWILSMFSEMMLISRGDIKNVIIPKIVERIKRGEFDGDVDSLIDITLFLWMLNYQALELVPYVFSKKNWHLSNISPKSNLRLNLLLQAILIENSDLSKAISVKPTEVPSNVYSNFQLQKRPLVQKIFGKLQGMCKQLDLNKFELSQAIPHVNIIGIIGYKTGGQKMVHVEILDDYTRIKNVDDVPVGLMALKLRLLDQSEEGLLLVSQKEVEEMTDAELDEYLLDELKIIC